MHGNLFLLGHILDLRKASGDNRVVEHYEKDAENLNDCRLCKVKIYSEGL